MFNPGIFAPDVQQKYKDHFANKGWLAIDDILSEEYINILYQSVPTLNYDYRGGVGDWYETVPFHKPGDGELLKQKVFHLNFITIVNILIDNIFKYYLWNYFVIINFVIHPFVFGHFLSSR